MRQISRRGIDKLKRHSMPSILGTAGILAGYAALLSIRGETHTWVFYFAALFLSAFGFLFTKKYVADLVDEVWDTGTVLLVKNAGRETRIPIKDVENISSGIWRPFSRVTVTLRTRYAFGRTFAFAMESDPAGTGRSSSEVLEELRSRVVVRNNG